MAAPSGVVAVLEAEFRLLAAEARSKEGLAGFFSGAGDQQVVKDAAERVILKVRGYADQPDALEQIKAHYQVRGGGCALGAGPGGSPHASAAALWVLGRGAAGRVPHASAAGQGCWAGGLRGVTPASAASALLLAAANHARILCCMQQAASCAACELLLLVLFVQELLKPLQLSLETKSDRLKSRALALVQNLIANHALPAGASDAVIAMLARADRNTDENVQLKTLQTALTLLQSPLRPRTEGQVGAVLGICLRLTSKKGHKDAVLTTAAATVRQAVALVLSYVDVEAELQRGDGGRPHPGAPPGGAEPVVEGGGAGGEEAAGPGGAAAAAQKLVEDLCNMAAGAVLAAICFQCRVQKLWHSRAGADPVWRPRSTLSPLCPPYRRCPCRSPPRLAHLALPPTRLRSGAPGLCAAQLARRILPAAALPSRRGTAHPAADPGAAAGPPGRRRRGGLLCHRQLRHVQVAAAPGPHPAAQLLPAAGPAQRHAGAGAAGR
jgi:hypothetical protein